MTEDIPDENLIPAGESSTPSVTITLQLPSTTDDDLDMHVFEGDELHACSINKGAHVEVSDLDVHERKLVQIKVGPQHFDLLHLIGEGKSVKPFPTLLKIYF